MSSFLERVKLLQSEINKSYKQQLNYDFWVQFSDSINKICDKSIDANADIEIAARKNMEDFLNSANLNIASYESDAFKLLNFMFDYALNNSSLSRLPFLMIHDIIESQTIAQAESMWGIIESLIEKITHPDLFTKGKLLILKTCNSLLRKLSKSCNTEFCGRILMLLAAIYPLSEKSALNLSAKVSVNLTYYEEENMFNVNTGQVSSAVSDNVTEEMNVADTTTTAAAAMSPHDQDINTSSFTYDLYRSFWQLQSFLADDQYRFIDSTTAWKEFMSYATRVVTLFEKNAFNKKNGQLARHQKRQQDAGDDDNGTNSTTITMMQQQLFALQLHDPVVRLQICSQIIYFLHYTRIKSLPALLSAPSSATTSSIELHTIMSKDILQMYNRTCKLIENTPGDSSSGAAVADGSQLLAVLQRLLWHERHFIAWKAVGCPPYQKIETTAVATVSSEDAATRKRKLHKEDEWLSPPPLSSSSSHFIKYNQCSNAFNKYKKRLTPGSTTTTTTTLSSSTTTTSNDSSSSLTKDNKARLLSGYEFDYSENHVKEVAKDLMQNIPSYENEIQMYIEADDPDAGIEEEYHPKNNNLFCWRTRRLMAARHLSAFAAMPDGDIGKGIRALYPHLGNNDVSNADEEVTVEGAASAHLVDKDPITYNIHNDQCDDGNCSGHAVATENTKKEQCDISNVTDEALDNDGTTNISINNNSNIITATIAETEEGEEVE